MKRLFAFILASFSVSIVHAVNPIISYVQLSTGSQQQGLVSVTTGTFSNVNALSASTSTFYGPLTLSLQPVTGATVTLKNGGSLTLGTTYYYKVWPSQGLNMGGPSQEMTIYPNGSSQTVHIAWNAVPGSNFYRVSQGNSQGSENGYFQTVNTSTDDAGQTLTSTQAATNGLNIFNLQTNGGIIIPAGFGINWTDWVTGAPAPGIAVTSAGEMNFTAGSSLSGDAAPSQYVFSDDLGGLCLKIFPPYKGSTNTGVDLYSPASNGAFEQMIIDASSIAFRPNGTVFVEIKPNLMNINGGQVTFSTGAQLQLGNNYNGSSTGNSVIWNASISSTAPRAIEFDTSVTSAVVINDNGDLYLGKGMINGPGFFRTRQTNNAIAFQASSTFTWTFTPSFVDTNYTISCTASASAGDLSGLSIGYASKATTGFTSYVRNNTGQTANITEDCMAIKD